MHKFLNSIKYGFLAIIKFSGKVRFFLILLGFLLPFQAFAMDKAMLEIKLKIAFIAKFIQFMDGHWKEGLADNKIEMSIFGNLNKGEKDFIKKFEAQKVKAATISISFNPTDIKDSDVIFFMTGSEKKVEGLLAKAKPAALTVGDTKYFLDKGGIVEFYEYRGKVRFKIDNEQAVKSGIRFNAKLLELADSR